MRSAWCSHCIGGGDSFVHDSAVACDVNVVVGKSAREVAHVNSCVPCRHSWGHCLAIHARPEAALEKVSPLLAKLREFARQPGRLQAIGWIKSV